MAKKTNTQTQDQHEALIVTKDGLAELVAERDERLLKRDQIAKDIDEARRLGDLKENEPYAAAMQSKELNDTRLDELEYMISIAQVVESTDDSSVGIGTSVEIENTSNSSVRNVTLVGRQAAQESNPREGKISIDSPLGKALHMAKIGAMIEVDLPMGKAQYKVVRIVK